MTGIVEVGKSEQEKGGNEGRERRGARERRGEKEEVRRGEKEEERKSGILKGSLVAPRSNRCTVELNRRSSEKENELSTRRYWEKGRKK
jgi:hypothetical protein